MKRFSVRRFLIALVLSLIAFAGVTREMFFPSPGHSAQVLRVPPADGKAHRKGEIDTKVVVTFGYSQFKDWRNQIARHKTAHSLGTMHLEDGEFRRYSSFSNGRGSGWARVGFGTYTATYEFPLAEAPKTAGPLTFKASVSDGAGWTLPFSIPLNN